MKCRKHDYEARRNRRPDRRAYLNQRAAVYRKDQRYRKPPRDITCRFCGRVFQAKGRITVCSERCRRGVHARQFRTWIRTHAQPRGPFFCRMCGEKFMPEYANKSRVFCSDRCARVFWSTQQSVKDRKREYEKRRMLALAKGKRIGWADVARLSGWKCHICGKLVDKTKRVPHPLAPTLDHLVPLAQDPDGHRLDNIKLAHFICNSRRGFAGPAQLALPYSGVLKSLEMAK